MVRGLQSRILCDSVDCSLPGSSVHGVLQARRLEWVAISFSRGSSQPHVSCLAYIGRQILYHCTTWEAHGQEQVPLKLCQAEGNVQAMLVSPHFAYLVSLESFASQFQDLFQPQLPLVSWVVVPDSSWSVSCPQAQFTVYCAGQRSCCKASGSLMLLCGIWSTRIILGSGV